MPEHCRLHFHEGSLWQKCWQQETLPICMFALEMSEMTSLAVLQKRGEFTTQLTDSMTHENGNFTTFATLFSFDVGIRLQNLQSNPPGVTLSKFKTHFASSTGVRR